MRSDDLLDLRLIGDIRGDGLHVQPVGGQASAAAPSSFSGPAWRPS